MDDDFNTALAISNLYGLFKNIKARLNQNDLTVGAELNQIKKTYSLLGLFEENASEFIASIDAKTNSAIPEEIEQIAKERFLARQNKDWAKSDELRNLLAEKGYDIKDAKDGYTLSKK